MTRHRPATCYGALRPRGTVVLPEISACTRRIEASKENDLPACAIVRHDGRLPRSRSCDGAPSPVGPIPFPGVAVVRAVIWVGTSEKDRLAASIVVRNRITLQGERRTSGRRPYGCLKGRIEEDGEFETARIDADSDTPLEICELGIALCPPRVDHIGACHR